MVSAKAHNVENNLIDFGVAVEEFKSVALHEKQLGILGSFSAVAGGHENQITGHSDTYRHLASSLANKSSNPRTFP